MRIHKDIADRRLSELRAGILEGANNVQRLRCLLTYLDLVHGTYCRQTRTVKTSYNNTVSRIIPKFKDIYIKIDDLFKEGALYGNVIAYSSLVSIWNWSVIKDIMAHYKISNLYYEDKLPININTLESVPELQYESIRTNLDSIYYELFVSISNRYPNLTFKESVIDYIEELSVKSIEDAYNLSEIFISEFTDNSDKISLMHKLIEKGI